MFHACRDMDSNARNTRANIAAFPAAAHHKRQRRDARNMHTTGIKKYQ